MFMFLSLQTFLRLTVKGRRSSTSHLASWILVPGVSRPVGSVPQLDETVSPHVVLAAQSTHRSTQRLKMLH